MRSIPLHSALIATSLAFAGAAFPAAHDSRSSHASMNLAVGPQYGSTHVYVAAEDMDRFVASFVATFGGSASQKFVTTVTPTPSQTTFQFVLTPVGTLSVFGFTSPIPYPFGSERSGYLVADLDAAVRAARADGADIIVAPFPDSIGRDVVIQWPGGVNMQLYWHKTAPSYAKLERLPENRVYLSSVKADEFIRRFVHFSHGKIKSDEHTVPGLEIGRPDASYRLVRIESRFGNFSVIVSDGHLPYPYGRELTGYEVANLADTLSSAKASGASVLVAPFTSRGRQAAVVQFPGGYIAEIHASGND